MKVKTKTTTKVTKSTRKGPYVKAKSQKKFVAKIAKQVMSRMSENKQVVKAFNINPQILQASSVTTVNNIFSITPCSQTTAAPNIAPGVSSGERVGNKVRTKSVKLNITIFPNQYNATTNTGPCPMYIRMYLVKKRLNPNTMPTVTQLCDTTFGDFFRYGDLTTGFTGSLVDMNMYVNEEKYIYLKHFDFKLGYSSNNGTGAGTQPTYQYFNNNDFKLSFVKSINVTKYCPKQILWDNDLQETTTAPVWVIMQGVAANGGILPLSQLPWYINTFTTFEYEDD